MHAMRALHNFYGFSLKGELNWLYTLYVDFLKVIIGLVMSIGIGMNGMNKGEKKCWLIRKAVFDRVKKEGYGNEKWEKKGWIVIGSYTKKVWECNPISISIVSFN